MKRLTATLAAGATSLTFTDDVMNSNSIIEIYAVDMDVYPIDQQQTGEHSVTATFNAQQEAVNVVCLVNNITTLSQPETALNVTYDNTDSGLEAENVQDAIDELAQSGGGGGEIYDKNTDAIIGKWYDGRNIKRHWHQWNSHWTNANKKTSPLSLQDLGADFVIRICYFDLVRKISMPVKACGMDNNDGTGNFSIWLNDYFSATDQDTVLIYDYVEAE